MEIKLKLKIKDVEIELSEKEVTELRDIIERLFPKQSIQYVPYYPYTWTTPWIREPWIIYRNGSGNNVSYTAELTSK
jgi:hypothetical protein